MAKQLVRSKQYDAKLLQMKSHMQSMQMQMQMSKSTEAMTAGMRKAVHTMAMMNRSLNSVALRNLLRQYSVENDRMEFSQEMVGESVDGAVEDEGEEEEQDRIVDQTLAELGVKADAVPIAPQASAPASGAPDAGANGSDLEGRLQNLRRT